MKFVRDLIGPRLDLHPFKLTRIWGNINVTPVTYRQDSSTPQTTSLNSKVTHEEFKQPMSTQLIAYSTVTRVWQVLIALYEFVLSALLFTWSNIFSHGWVYLRNVGVVLFIDALLTDDEPIWEPVEWSLVQSWIMFIFLFAWIAENLIISRYGSYTGRDKRVWFSWYKTFWLIELFYSLSLGAACMFVITPFYFEITYNVPFIASWWDWYSRVFFFKFISTYTVAIVVASYLQTNLRTMSWESGLVLILLVTLLLSYLLYTQFIVSFFCYFTDPVWYRTNRLVDYVQLSHEPLRWGYGPAKRDHYAYHKTTTVFWFKNDGPFASAFLLIQFFFFFALFSMYLYWVTLVRRVISTQEIPYTYCTYCVSALRQFLYFFALILWLSVISFFIAYWRLPLDFVWVTNGSPFWSHFAEVMLNYTDLLTSLFR